MGQKANFLMLMIENWNLYNFRDEIENNILAKKNKNQNKKLLTLAFFFKDPNI